MGLRRNDIIARLKQAEPALQRVAWGAVPIWFVCAGRRASRLRCGYFYRSGVRRAFWFLNYMDAYEEIRKAIGREVEIGYSTRDGLSHYVRPNIESEAIRIF